MTRRNGNLERRLWRLAGRLARGGRQPVLSVLIFHRVLAQPDPLRPDDPVAGEFEEIVRGIARAFDVVSLGDAPDYLERASGHGVAITFDDGYEDNHSLAAPILKKHAVPATFFVTTGTLERGCMWNDLVIEAVRRLPEGKTGWGRAGFDTLAIGSEADRLPLVRRILPALKYRPPAERGELAAGLARLAGIDAPPPFMMTREEVAALDREPLFEIGAHTVNHPILASVPDTEARAEIADGKAALEALLGREVDKFAYPNGAPGRDYRREHVAMVEAAGFRLAVTTSPGAVRPRKSRMQWPRQSVWQKERLRALAGIVRESRREGEAL